MSEVNDSVMGILAHGVACAELSTVVDDELPCRGVLVFEVPSVTLQKVSING